MKVEDILTLAKAGFSAQQIATMAAITVDKQDAPAPAQDAPKAPDPAPKAPDPAPKAPDPVPAHDSDVTKDNFNLLMQQIGMLRTEVQSANIKASEQPAAPQETAESILASIINPPAKGGY